MQKTFFAPRKIVQKFQKNFDRKRIRLITTLANMNIIDGKIIDTGLEKYKSHPLLGKNLGAAALETLSKNTSEHFIYDHSLNRKMNRGTLLATALCIKDFIERNFADQPRIGIALPSGIAGLAVNLACQMAGKSSVEVLKKLEINTIGDLAQSDPRLIMLHLKSHGKMLWEFANGIGTSVVQSEPDEAKGIGNSTTLSEDAATMEEIRPVFERLAQSVGGRLKKAGKKAGMVSMEIKYYDFRTVSHQIQMDKPTNDPEVLKETACSLFLEVWSGEPVRLLGIRTSKLTDEAAPEQLSIFDIEIPKEPDEKHKRLKKAMDELNERFGEGAVMKASLMPKKPHNK